MSPTPPPLPCTLECPECGRGVHVSAEDPPAGYSEMYRHLGWDHAQKNAASVEDASRITGELMTRVRVIPDA